MITLKILLYFTPQELLFLANPRLYHKGNVCVCVKGKLYKGHVHLYGIVFFSPLKNSLVFSFLSFLVSVINPSQTLHWHSFPSWETYQPVFSLETSFLELCSLAPIWVCFLCLCHSCLGVSLHHHFGYSLLFCLCWILYFLKALIILSGLLLVLVERVI